MKYPPESLKSFCNRVAEAAVSEDGARLARLLRLTGLLGEPADSVCDPADFDAMARVDAEGALPVPPNRVGIWEGKSENGKTCFVRRVEVFKEWGHWANCGRIEPKGDRKRVLLIGESVARGYLYDPQFTPAMALTAILEGQMGTEQVEVIDLARTNLGLEVRELATSALLLEPDAVLIFGGNNWSAPFRSQTLEAAYIAAVLRDQGVPGLKLRAEGRLAGTVRHLVREVSSLYEAKGVPLVWIVPEFNLGDWRDPSTNAPHLPGTGNRDWIDYRQAAQKALDAGDLLKAAELAKRMVELDQGVAVAGLYILAECSQRSGDLEAARRYLERARDAVLWDYSKNIAPRPLSVVQEALRSEVAKGKSALVDMPQIFREYLVGGIPGRRLFLDYCHLTAEGIRVAMAAAASEVLRVLQGVEVPWQDLVDEDIAPSREVEAEATFLAAIHNAHWWQSYDLICYYCSSSVRASPAIAKMMNHFMDLQARRTPMLMCQAAEEIADLGSPLIQHYLLRYNHQQLDQLLIDAIVSSLLEIGVDTGERLTQLRREEHSVTRGATDLLDFYYCSAGLQPQEVMWVMRRGEKPRQRNASPFYYKAYWIHSRFVFVGEAGCPVRLCLTCRLPGQGPSQGAMILELNGRPQAEIAVGREWETWDLAVPGEAVQEGLNEIVIHWPLTDFPGEKALDSAGEDLIVGSIPEFYSSFGEIHRFTVADGRKTGTVPLVCQENATRVGSDWRHEETEFQAAALEKDGQDLGV